MIDRKFRQRCRYCFRRLCFTLNESRNPYCHKNIDSGHWAVHFVTKREASRWTLVGPGATSACPICATSLTEGVDFVILIGVHLQDKLGALTDRSVYAIFRISL